VEPKQKPKQQNPYLHTPFTFNNPTQKGADGKFKFNEHKKDNFFKTAKI